MQKQERGFPILAAVAAGTQLLGNVMQASNDRKNAKKINQRIAQMSKSYAETRAIGAKQLQRDINQQRGSNVTSQASSGFAMESFSGINDLFDIQAKENIDLYNKETQLGLQQIQAGQVQKPNALIQGLNIASNAFGSFSNLF